MGLRVFGDLLESSAHDSNDHVQDDKQRDQRSHEEDDPEANDVVSVLLEVASDLKVAQCQAIRVNHAVPEATDVSVVWLDRILVQHPEQQGLSEHYEAKHACKGQRVNDDLLQLAHECRKEVEDSNPCKQFDHVRLNVKNDSVTNTHPEDLCTIRVLERT